MMKKETSVEEKIVFGIGRIVAWPFKTLFGSTSSKSQKNRQSIDRQFVQSSWKEIEEMMNLAGAAHFRQAVTQADNLFDYVLKGCVVHGETMGERLKSAAALMSKDVYDQVWQAHKLRNRIVHEANLELMNWEAKQAIEQYKKGLIELKAM